MKNNMLMVRWPAAKLGRFDFGEVISLAKKRQDNRGRLHVRLLSRGLGVLPNESGERWAWVPADALTARPGTADFEANEESLTDEIDGIETLERNPA